MRDQQLKKKHFSRARMLAAAALAATFGSALALNALPGKKPGLWVSSRVMHFNVSGKPADTDNTPQVTAMCTDASTDAIEAKLLAGGSGACGLHVEGAGQMVTQGKIVWKSETAIHMESQSTSPHMSGSVVADAKWVGPCPAGVMPGDQGSFVNGVFTKSGNIKDALPKAQ